MNKIDFMTKYNMTELSEEDGFLIDIIYATPNNFTYEWWHFDDSDEYEIISEMYEQFSKKEEIKCR